MTLSQVKIVAISLCSTLRVSPLHGTLHSSICNPNRPQNEPYMQVAASPPATMGTAHRLKKCIA